jgi:hypothetical protein
VPVVPANVWGDWFFSAPIPIGRTQDALRHWVRGSNGMANVRILLPESVTPIGVYLDRSAAAPTAYAAQVDLATALLYREDEYRGMYLYGLHPSPGPHPDSPFHPFDLTSATAVSHWYRVVDPSGDQSSGPSGPHDLFGLKSTVTMRLLAVLRPVASHRMGWVIAAQLLDDLCRHGEARHAAEEAVRHGAARFGLMLACQVIWSEALRSGTDPAVALKEERAITARARRAGVPTDRTGRWATLDVRRELDEWLQRAGVRVRSRVEGESFTRFVTTDRRFCEAERRAAMASVDLARVPMELRPLADLALAIGVGDDPCRACFIRAMTKASRREAASRIRAADEAIQAWLRDLVEPYDAEAAAFFWLSAAGEELDDRH